MENNSPYTIRTWMAALAYALTGCFSTELPPLTPPPATARLEGLADAEIAVTIDDAHVRGHRGYQFLTAVPVTRVYTPSLVSDVMDSLKVQVGLRGYRAVAPEQASAPAYRLDVVIEDFTVSGYCYAIVRRPKASTVLSGTLRSPTGEVLRQCSGDAKFGLTTKFAFAEELNEVRRIALTDAAKALLECLELKKAPHRL